MFISCCTALVILLKVITPSGSSSNAFCKYSFDRHSSAASNVCYQGKIAAVKAIEAVVTIAMPIMRTFVFVTHYRVLTVHRRISLLLSEFDHDARPM